MRHFLLLIFASISSLLFGQALKWDKSQHQFGAFREDVGQVSCIFTAVNTGQKPVVILSSQANCGCTRPRYDKNTVEPGDTLKLYVSFDPAGRPGRFAKSIRLTTDETNYRLNIRGTVIASEGTLASRYPIAVGSARISNSVVPFGETTKGHILAAAVNIYNPTNDTIYPAISGKPDYINGIFSQPSIAPGTQNTLSLTAYTDLCPLWGTVTDSLTLIPDMTHPDKAITLSTVSIIKEDFSTLSESQRKKAPVAMLSLTHVDFPDLSHNNTAASVTLTNTGENTLIVRRIFCPDKAVAVSIDKTNIKHQQHAIITIKIDPTKIAADGILDARLTVITNDPDHPTQIIKITALR
ncbi:MAG: DUF1573 domain-containing protein [Paramuribaculum sp.]|nr:DUF1573 domain-containing protein [Paramuribaculum sp.]